MLSAAFLALKGIDFNDPVIRNELEHLQANILYGHGRDNVRCVFLGFNSAKKDEIKEWIQQLNITSAFKQLSDRSAYKESLAAKKKAPEKELYDAGPVTCFFLAASGYRKLKTESIPDGIAFNAGMRDRRTLLSDPATKAWQPEYQPETDAMLLLADDYPARLDKALQHILNTIANNSIAINILQKGEALRDPKTGMGIEHFGYADALSQPQYLHDYTPGKVWDDTVSLDAVLVPDPGAKKDDGSADESCYGSFFVFRKLEQHVKTFSDAEDLLGDTLLPNEPNDELKEVAGAFAVGRFENSTPVVKHKTAIEIKTEGKPDNDFTYALAGDISKCPYHAHIRLMNPRKSDPVEMNHAIPGYIKPGRITRRGIPYDEAGRNNDLDWKPEGNVGLLFMAYQSSIEDAFEAMQKSANIADGIIGQNTDTKNQLWPMQWGNEAYQLKGFGFTKFVTLKGGEYFFAPSIPFLKKI